MSKSLARAGIALGSNLGDRAANLRAALDGLRAMTAPGTAVVVAPVFETEPQGCPDGSPAFLNTVVEIGWGQPPAALLEATRALETRLGRTPDPQRNAPRVIDIDILYCGDAVVDATGLVLPHPRLAERRFVLVPLAEIRPGWVPPGGSATVAEMLGALDSPEAVPHRFHAPGWPA